MTILNKYLTRQAIFDKRHNVVAYELLHNTVGELAPGETTMLSDAVTIYGLPNLTNSKPAYVPFTERMIWDELEMRPTDMVIELQTGIVPNEDLIQRLRTLKARGYRLALAGFDGRSSAAAFIPLLNVLKVDFRRTSPEEQMAYTLWLRRSRQLSMLAENVCTKAEFDRAVKSGYTYFQGVYFEDPRDPGHSKPRLVTSAHMQILTELNHGEDANYNKIARIVYADASLTYQLMQKISTAKYYRNKTISINSVNAIGQALVMMGLDEVRRWILLVLAREHNVADSDEMIRSAFLRATFCRCLAQKSREQVEPEMAFLLGMFSMLDRIMGQSLQSLLSEVRIDPELVDALFETKDNFFARLLRFVKDYEHKVERDASSCIALDATSEQIAHFYLDCIVETDQTFTTIGEK